ncbi:MAG: T9SS type A sorting domain-containing protein [bacterium]|nr:T9SS type A sorting domain-containing protein [bacterium]
MKRLIVLILMATVAAFAIAADVNKDVNNVNGVLGVEVSVPVSAPAQVVTNDQTQEEIVAYNAMKLRYAELMNLAVANLATVAELNELNDIAVTMEWQLFTVEARGEEGSLDQGSTDTLSNCGAATVIPSVPYSDTGVLDGDNDCSVVSASPYNEVFYTFTPSVSGSYFFRGARAGATAAQAAIRIMSGACCAGATSIGFSSGTVGVDCGEPSSRVTYARADLVAGTQYWIHVGTSSSTAGIVDPYEFSMYLLPSCPTNESATDHSTCATAQYIAVGDSILGDSASSTTPDWYMFELPAGDSVRIDVYSRAQGNCLSGTYPQNSTLVADARFSFWKGCSGLAADSIGGDDDGTHGITTCQYDAAQAYCLNAGTYYVKVYNNLYNAYSYIVKVTSLGPCTTAPVDCNTLVACGAPAEVEPNGLCTDAANILNLDCGNTYYGILCPGNTDRDYWYVPATTGANQTTVLLSDGADCSTFPPAILGMRVATTTTGTCTTPSGSFAGGLVFGGCFPWPGGWISVDRAAASGQSTYKLTVTCAEYTCACPTYAGTNIAQFQGGCLGKIPFGAGLSSGPSSFFFNVDQQYNITDIDVCVAITHTYDADLDVYLISPWADTVLLSDDNGAGNDNYYVTTFDDEATTSVTLGAAPFNGSYIPEEALSALDGNNALGTWEFYIVDDTGGDSGYVHCLSLNISYDIILNVELANFAAVAGDGSVTLNWATASETDNDHFVIKRDGIELAEVAATNNSAGSSYSWVDNNVSNGLSYEYSLFAVDVNGASQLLGTMSATPEANAVVTEYALHQNYPNPFNPSTNITFDLVEAGRVNISVFNVMGQKVAELVNGQMNAGRHNISFDAVGLSSGLYLYKMEVNGFTAQNKMLLLK